MSKIRLPLILINFKTYKSATGGNAVKLAKICENVANDTKSSIAIAVQAADIYRVSQAVSIPVFAQHIDNIDYGKNTGRILAFDAKENGAIGTLLNHSERRLRLDVLEQSIKMAKKAGLFTIVCANDPIVGKAVSAFSCDMVAVEPPELIGTGISVSKAKPQVVTDSVHSICGKKTCSMVLVGAGVMNGEDVRKSLELGASGVLVASGVTKADNPQKEIMDLVKGLKA